jgi:peptidylprolyl isomerase
MANKAGPNKQAARLRAARQAQAAAEKRRRVVRQRIIVAAVVVAAIAVGVIVTLTGGGSSKKKDTTTTSTTAAAASAAGKPCLAVSDPLPAGAPAVPVKVGPPPDKLVVEDLKPGTGAAVGASDTLTVNYIGVSCSTGKIFDSSFKGGQPATFPLSGVIPGWQQGLVGMKVGGERLLGIPPSLGYGTAGQPPTIAPDETLWFVVDVLDAKPA